MTGFLISLLFFKEGLSDVTEKLVLSIFLCVCVCVGSNLLLLYFRRIYTPPFEKSIR